MKVATIIVTYNGAAYIEKCIQSLLLATPLKHQIFLIDNNSQDETLRIVESKFPSVIVHRSNSNIGFGQANNVGLAQALDWGANHFFLINQDAWVEVDCLQKLVETAINNPRYGIISPIHLNGTGTGFDHGFIQHLSRNGESSEILLDLLHHQPKDIYPVAFVNAAAWLVSKQCLEKVGGFAPLFFHYGEDDNYVHRAVYHGFNLGVVSKSFIYHNRSAFASKDDWAMLFRLFMIQAGNVNLNFQEILRETYLSWLKAAIKNFILFRWETALGFLTGIWKVRLIKAKIEKTREQTLISGQTYLKS